MNQDFQANFSTLIMSIASSAAMALGLAPNPDDKIDKDKDMARFNIDLLIMLQSKTKNNLTEDERHFLDAVVSDLQIKFTQM